MKARTFFLMFFCLIISSSLIFGQSLLNGSFYANDKLSGNIEFKINRSNAYSRNWVKIPADTLVQVARRACNNWNNVIGSYTNVTLSVSSDTTTTEADSDFDGISVIYFASLVGITGQEIDHVSNGVIVESDIELRSNDWWSCYQTCPNDEWDLESVLTHEMGHSLGLGDLEPQYTAYRLINTMWDRDGTYGDTWQRTLKAGDKAGAIYQSGKTLTGTIPFTQEWTASHSVSLTGNVYIPSGDSLLFHDIASSSTISLNNHDIVSTGGYLGFDGTSLEQIKPFYSIKKSDGNYKGFYHSFSAAIESLSTAGAGAYIYICKNDTVYSGNTLSIPANTPIKFGGGKVLYVYGTLNITGGSIFDAYDSNKWSGIYVKANGSLNISGGITLKNATRGFGFESSNISFPTLSKTTLYNCAQTGDGNRSIYVNGCSPTIDYVHITNAGGSAIYVTGAASFPHAHCCTMDSTKWGMYINQGSDAHLTYSILQNLQDNCIYLFKDGSSYGHIDMSWGCNDIRPVSSSFFAINNPNNLPNSYSPHIHAGNNYWGPNFNASLLFANPDSVYYTPVANNPFGYGAGKIVTIQKEPLNAGFYQEQAKDWQGALDIYYGIIVDSKENIDKSRALKSIIRVNEVNHLSFADLRRTMQYELLAASSDYKLTLDYLLCDILIRERKYSDAVNAFSAFSSAYKGYPVEAEAFCRMAMLYGDFLNDKQQAKVYADKAAAINPGNDILESAYQSAGLTYDPSLYKNAFTANNSITSQPSEPKVDDQSSGDYVSISPNPANPVTTITYSLALPSKVRLDIFAVNGQKVTTLVHGAISAGVHAVKFDGSHYGTGIYFYRFASDRFTKTGKMLLLK